MTPAFALHGGAGVMRVEEFPPNRREAVEDALRHVATSAWRDLLVREPPQAQALLGRADELLPSRDALAADGDEVVLLARQQVRAVEHEQRLTRLD